MIDSDTDASRENVAGQDEIGGEAIPGMRESRRSVLVPGEMISIKAREGREAVLHYDGRGLAHGKADMAVFLNSFPSSIKGVKRTLQKRPLLALHECSKGPETGVTEYFSGFSIKRPKVCFDKHQTAESPASILAQAEEFGRRAFI